MRSDALAGAADATLTARWTYNPMGDRAKSMFSQRGDPDQRASPVRLGPGLHAVIPQLALEGARRGKVHRDQLRHIRRLLNITVEA